jgi:hypothetical protein
MLNRFSYILLFFLSKKLKQVAVIDFIRRIAGGL